MTSQRYRTMLEVGMIISLIDPDRGFAKPEVVGIATEQPIDPV